MSSKGDLFPSLGTGPWISVTNRGCSASQRARLGQARVPGIARVTGVQAHCRDGVFQVGAGVGAEPHIHTRAGKRHLSSCLSLCSASGKDS